MGDKLSAGSAGAGVIRRIWIAAAVMAFALLAVVALVMDRASRVADEFALASDRRMIALEFDRIGDDAVRQFNEIAYWDSSVEAINKRESPDPDFIEEEVANWLTDELEFSVAAVVTEAGRAKFAVVDGEVITEVSGLSLLGGNDDLVELARQLYRERRIGSSNGFMIMPPSGSFVAGIEARAWRMIDGQPGLVIAQVIVPESQDLALKEGEADVLIGVRPLDRPAVQDFGRRIGILDAMILPVSEAATHPTTSPLQGDLPAELMLEWRPKAPRPVVIAATLPLAATLYIVILCAIAYILFRHSAALRALAASEAENRFLATHDTLTRLANRAHFDRQLGQAFEAMERSRFAVLCIDLDRFKAVNDTHGHHAGDAVLREVSSRFRHRVGDKGLVARVGGDEFIALVHTAGNREALVSLAQGLIADATTPVHFGRLALQIGASVGIAVAPDDGRNARDLIHAADMALYRAKAAGRGTACQAGDEWEESDGDMAVRAVA